jgi:signal transduction histidine kinase
MAPPDRLPGYAGPKRLRQLLNAVLAVASDLDLSSVLEHLVESAVELVDARYGALGVLDETRTKLAQFITVGFDSGTVQAIGNLPEGHGILGLLIVDPRPLRLPDLNEHPDSYGFPPNHPPMQSFLGVPIRIRNEVFGNLYLTDKTTSDAFTDIDEELIVALAAAAAIAIENARLHQRVGDLLVLEDRERIARDLHDTVIQRLFATGLSLQGAARLAVRPEVATRIQSAVNDLDETVKQIRSAIFELQSTRLLGRGLRDDILALVAEAARPLGFDPHVVFDGPVDTGVDDRVCEHLLATLREALSNAARHARPSRVDIEVTVDSEVVLRVADDGVGIGEASPSGRGLGNLAARAKSLGGRFRLEPRPEGGTVLEWRAPAKLSG